MRQKPDYKIHHLCHQIWFLLALLSLSISRPLSLSLSSLIPNCIEYLLFRILIFPSLDYFYFIFVLDEFLPFDTFPPYHHHDSYTGTKANKSNLSRNLFHQELTTDDVLKRDSQIFFFRININEVAHLITTISPSITDTSLLCPVRCNDSFLLRTIRRQISLCCFLYSYPRR